MHRTLGHATGVKEIAIAELADIKEPTILVSRCLGFCRHRCNGYALYNDFVESPKPESLKKS